MKPLTIVERAAIQNAQRAVRRIANEVPDDLGGEELVVALCNLLHGMNDLAGIGVAAAAIAALVESERATERGERSIVA